VPVSKLFQYEAGLLSLLASIPDPQQLAAAQKARASPMHATLPPPPSAQSGEDATTNDAAVANGGIYRAPAARPSTDGPLMLSLLDAIVAAPVPEAMASASRLDLHSSLREATLAFVRRSARIADATRQADHAAAASAQAEAAAILARRSAKKSLWQTLTGGAAEAEAAEAAAASASNVAEARKAALRYADEPTRVSDIASYLRLDATTSLEDLPPVWQALHIATAEYTRRFNGEPIVDAMEDQ
jgi:hypothetical protein